MSVDTAAQLTGLQQLEANMEDGGRPGLARALDFDLVEVGDGHAAFEANLTEVDGRLYAIATSTVVVFER